MDYESQRVEFWCYYEDRLAEFYKELCRSRKRAVPNRHQGLYRTPGVGKDIIARKIRVRCQRSLPKLQNILQCKALRAKVLPYYRLAVTKSRNSLREWLQRRSNFAR